MRLASYIRFALGLTVREPFPAEIAQCVARAPRSNIVIKTTIIEAEMVAYNTKTQQIDEFWRIADIKHGNAIDDSSQSTCADTTETESCQTLPQKTQIKQVHSSKRRLALVFFDIIELNGNSLIRGS